MFSLIIETKHICTSILWIEMTLGIDNVGVFKRKRNPTCCWWNEEEEEEEELKMRMKCKWWWGLRSGLKWSMDLDFYSMAHLLPDAASLLTFHSPQKVRKILHNLYKILYCLM